MDSRSFNWSPNTGAILAHNLLQLRLAFPLLTSIGVHTGISTPRLPDHNAGVGTLPPRCYLAHMCGRFAVFASAKELSRALGCPGLATFRVERRFNIAPGQWVITVRPEHDQRVPTLARWGLVPSWSKEPEAGPRPINARAEGIGSKPTFRGALRHGRCLVPASGFYEWKTVGKTKTPHFIRPLGGGIFVFAGLVDHWSGPDGELTTCAIITTEANSLMQPIHDRMPVILTPDGAATWLTLDNRHPEDLLKPYSAEAMEMWEVGTAVGNPRNDSPELVDPVRLL